MRARRYVDSILEYSEKLDRQKTRAERLEARAARSTSSLSDMPRPASRDNQAQEKRIIEYAEAKKKVDLMEEELDRKKDEAMDLFSRFSSDRYEDAFYYRYIEEMLWSQVAEAMHISETYVYKLREKAIIELERILSEESDNQAS